MGKNCPGDNHLVNLVFSLDNEAQLYQNGQNCRLSGDRDTKAAELKGTLRPGTPQWPRGISIKGI